MGNACVHSFSAGNENIIQVLPASRRSLPAPFGGHLAGRQQIGVVVSIVLFVAVSQGYFAQQHEASVVFPRSKAVISRFGDHICEINSFSKHVACHWSLGRSYSEALAKDTHEIGQSAAVPKQLLVSNILSVARVFQILADFVDLFDLQFVGSVGGGVGVFDILDEKLVGL